MRVLHLLVVAATAACASLVGPSTSRAHGPLTVAPDSDTAATRDRSGQEAAGAATTARSAADRAVAVWSARAERLPQRADAWVQLGDAWMQKVRDTLDPAYYGRAEAAYARALALEPGNPAAAVGMAWVHGGRHEFPASIEWARKALAVDPDNAAAHGLIGDAAVERRDYERARIHYRAMLDARPDLGSYSRMGHLLHLTGDTPAAIRLMQRAIASGGPYAEHTAWCRAELARMYLDSGDVDAADAVVEAALAHTPRNARVLAAADGVRAARAVAHAAHATSPARATDVAE